MLTRPLWSLGTLLPLTAVAGALVFVYWAADRLLIEGPPPEGDVSALEWVSRERTSTMVDVSEILTFLGDLPVVVAVWVVLVTLARRRSGRWDLAWLVSVTIGGALAITGLIKEITDRARPDGALVEAASFAFPSGHAARAAAVWGLVAWLAARWGHNYLIKIGVATLAVAMAGATGVSRLILGIHWPSDVLFGWVLGAVWLIACILVVQPRHGAPRAETVLDELSDRLAVGLAHGDAERHHRRRRWGTGSGSDRDEPPAAAEDARGADAPEPATSGDHPRGEPDDGAGPR